MFEVKLFDGSFVWDVKTCDVGDLLPTIAALLQRFEAERGKYVYQHPYAVQWQRVKE